MCKNQSCATLKWGEFIRNFRKTNQSTGKLCLTDADSCHSIMLNNGQILADNSDITEIMVVRISNSFPKI